MCYICAASLIFDRINFAVTVEKARKPIAEWGLDSLSKSLSLQNSAQWMVNKSPVYSGLFSLMPFANSEGITSRTKQMVMPQEGAQVAMVGE